MVSLTVAGFAPKTAYTCFVSKQGLNLANKSFTTEEDCE